MANKRKEEIGRLREQNRQLQERLSSLESKVHGDPKKSGSRLHSFVASTWAHVVVMLIAFAVAFSGRLDSTGTTVCLVLAGLVGAGGLLYHVRKKPTAVGFALLLGGGLWGLDIWLLEKPGVLTAKQGEEFTAILKTALVVPTFTKIACPDADENVCIYANSFIPRFQRAGWKIDEVDGRPTLERVKLGRPTAAVMIVQHGPRLVDPQDPDHGVWTKINPFNQVLKTAFNRIGIEPDKTNDPDLPETIIRVYFGSIPKH
jgi:hypothetical protein